MGEPQIMYLTGQNGRSCTVSLSKYSYICQVQSLFRAMVKFRCQAEPMAPIWYFREKKVIFLTRPPQKHEDTWRKGNLSIKSPKYQEAGLRNNLIFFGEALGIHIFKV